MSKKSRERGEKRRAAEEAERVALAKQFKNPSLTITSKPPELGRSMFLKKSEADAYFSTMKHVDPSIKQEDPKTWNPKREEK